ncbi:MAG: DUF2975 domain-containing protein [Xanthomonadales bacterium]|jgi:hypothetical protein|nr:DUF2975 domain-containing protein [Xanthomonadales bacterium]
MPSDNPNRLTRLVKRALDLLQYLFLALAIAWPLAVLIIGLGISEDPDARHTDVHAFLNFRILAQEPVDTAAVHVESDQVLLSGNGNLKLNNTKSKLAWWVSGATTEILLLVVLYGVLVARKLFSSLVRGNAFSEGNADRVRRIGWVVVVWNLVAPLLVYLGGLLVLNDVAYDVQGIELYPDISLNLGGLLIGAAILVLAGVWREAAALHEDQALTI